MADKPNWNDGMVQYTWDDTPMFFIHKDGEYVEADPQPVIATPLPADAALGDECASVVAGLRRANDLLRSEGYHPEAFYFSKAANFIERMSARLRALSQPEVAQVPQSWIDTATKAKQLTPDVCKAYPGAASAHIAGLANLILRMAAPSAKGDKK